MEADSISSILPIFVKNTGREAEASVLESDRLEVLNGMLESKVTVEELIPNSSRKPCLCILEDIQDRHVRRNF